MSEQDEVSKEVNEEDQTYKELAARIEIIKMQNRELEEPRILNATDYIQVIAIIVICVCALIIGAFLAI